MSECDHQVIGCGRKSFRAPKIIEPRIDLAKGLKRGIDGDFRNRFQILRNFEAVKKFRKRFRARKKFIEKFWSKKSFVEILKKF